MSIYVYMTDQCLKDAKKHSYTEQVIKFKDQVEKLQSISRFDHFPPPYLKKRFERQIRLVASFKSYQVKNDEHVLVIFWRLLVRGDAGHDGYGSFLQDPVEFGKKYFTGLVTEETLDLYLKNRLAVTPVQLMDKPSDVEYEYLYVVKGNPEEQATEEKICESERWVQFTSAKDNQFLLATICGQLLELSRNPQKFIWKDPKRDLYIIYRVMPSHKTTFLAGLAKRKPDCDDILACYKEIFQEESEPDVEVVLRHSFRAYPELLTADENLWVGIQEDKEANLSLSPEETRLLDCVHHGQGSNQGYPLFINGRAGSGKSTILYFLFSDYVGHYLSLRKKHESAPQPILLSCSAELVERATDAVTNVLRSHYKRKLAGHVLDDSDAQAIVSCFAMFHSFLHQNLGDNLRERFNPPDYIDYSKFRRLWDARFGREPLMRKKGADMCWHVIRTYIKGMNPDGYLEPDDYEALPVKQKTVSFETYEFVFERVWNAWYKDLTVSTSSVAWDDQDLVRAIIERGESYSKYAVVFCDEAQDFTRIELDLIYRLSLFTMRKLTPQEEIPRLPFAFAGDPFQTINPTGFRWDAIKATFHEKLVDSLRLSPEIDVPFNYQELNHNYRSTRNIVRFCNAIQLFRAAAFDIPNLRPQIAWQAEQNSPVPIIFDRDNPSMWQGNLANETDITIIVPCLMGEEGDYVKGDPFLSKIVRCDDAGIPNNVLSPARAKGLEFNRVVLYSFGISAPSGLIDFLNQSSSFGKIDKRLEYEYFLNRVYVAASRPKRRLFIIDSHEGKKNLWDIVEDENIQQNCFQKMGEKAMDAWIEHIGGYQQGTAESWAEERGNTEEIAAMYEQRGLLLQDTFMLRSAALAYESMGNKQKNAFCKAHALRIEGKHEKAVKLFAVANDLEMSIACCWDGMLRDAIIDLSKQFTNVTDRPEYKFLYISKEPQITNLSDLLGDIVGLTESSKDFQVRLVREATWGKLLSQCIDKGKGNPVEWSGIAILTEKLLSKGMKLDSKSQAIMYYKAAKYDEVIRLCTMNNIEKSWEIYQQSQKKIAVDYYRNGETEKITPQGWEWIADDFIQEKQYEGALQCLLKTGDGAIFFKKADKFPIDSVVFNDVVLYCLVKMEASAQWEEILSFGRCALSGKNTSVCSDYISSFARKYKKEGATFFVWLCALSSNLNEQKNDIRRAVRNLTEKAIDASIGLLNTSIPIDIAGMALENSDALFKDILAFYEKAIEQKDISEEEKLFAKVHWMIVQERYAEYEENNQKTGTAKKKREDIDSRRREWKITSEIENKSMQLTKKISGALLAVKLISRPNTVAISEVPSVSTEVIKVPESKADKTHLDSPLVVPDHEKVIAEPLDSPATDTSKPVLEQKITEVSAKKRSYEISLLNLKLTYSPVKKRGSSRYRVGDFEHFFISPAAYKSVL